jgi:hypothetical protein
MRAAFTDRRGLTDRLFLVRRLVTAFRIVEEAFGRGC